MFIMCRITCRGAAQARTRARSPCTAHAAFASPLPCPARIVAPLRQGTGCRSPHRTAGPHGDYPGGDTACKLRLQTTRRRPRSGPRQRTLFVSMMPFAPSMARASDATRRAAATLCRLCRLTCACQAPADALRRQNTAHGSAAVPVLNVSMHGATWQTCCGAAADHPVTLGFACVCYGWPHQSDIADSRSHTLGGLAPKCINRASNAGHVCMKAKAAQEWPLA